MKSQPKLRARTKTAPFPPDAVAAALREAAEHRVAMRLDEAVAIYAAIERRNPDAVDASYFLALIDLARDRPLDARDRLKRLARRAPKSAEVWSALGYASEQLGEWTDAIAAYGRMIAADPTRPRTDLIGPLEVVGRIDEAIGISRELAGRPETRLQGLIGLAKLRPAEIEPADQAALTAAAAAAETPLDVRINANFMLGGVLEAQRDYDAAFAAFETGNGLKRAMLTGAIAAPDRPPIGPPTRTLDPAAFARQREASIRFMKSVFTAEFVAANSGRGHHIAAPIFVIGMPRSGSTLIEQILSSHGGVQGLGESGALSEVVAGQYPYDLFAANRPDHFRALAEAYFKAQHARGWLSASRFVDKMLINYMHVGMIHLMLPNAVILHSVRDPAETCFGAWRQNFLSGNESTYDLGDIGRDYVRYRDVMDHWARVLPGRVIEVSHEALVTEPERQIRGLVTEACGLAWDPACLRFHETKRAVRTASVAQVRQPIFTTALQRWRRYEKHLGPLFDALGRYAPAPTSSAPAGAQRNAGTHEH